jgi:hypothetical protein
MEFLIITYAWGWVLLSLLGLSILFIKRMRRLKYPLAIVVLLVAFLWQQATMALNFGANGQSVESPDGNSVVHFEHVGMWTFTLVVKRNDEVFRYHLPSGDEAEAPELIFWISPSLVGIEYEHEQDLVFDLDKYPDIREYRRLPLESEMDLFKEPINLVK